MTLHTAFNISGKLKTEILLIHLKNIFQNRYDTPPLIKKGVPGVK